MSEFPYGAYANFFATWFGNVIFISIAFIIWVAATVLLVFVLKGRTLWLRVLLAFVISAFHYLVFGRLIAGGRFGGEAEFFYDPALLMDNLFVHGGLQGILLWPLYLLPTGGIRIVLPVVIFGWGLWYSHKRRA